MHGRTKFVVSSLFALLWLGVSVAISIVWIQGVSQILPTWYVVWVVIGIALLPGYIMSAMFISNILNRRIKKQNTAMQALYASLYAPETSRTQFTRRLNIL